MNEQDARAKAREEIRARLALKRSAKDQTDEAPSSSADGETSPRGSDKPPPPSRSPRAPEKERLSRDSGGGVEESSLSSIGRAPSAGRLPARAPGPPPISPSPPPSSSVPSRARASAAEPRRERSEGRLVRSSERTTPSNASAAASPSLSSSVGGGGEDEETTRPLPVSRASTPDVRSRVSGVRTAAPPSPTPVSTSSSSSASSSSSSASSSSSSSSKGKSEAVPIAGKTVISPRPKSLPSESGVSPTHATIPAPSSPRQERPAVSPRGEGRSPRLDLSKLTNAAPPGASVVVALAPSSPRAPSPRSGVTTTTTTSTTSTTSERVQTVAQKEAEQQQQAKDVPRPKSPVPVASPRSAGTPPLPASSNESSFDGEHGLFAESSRRSRANSHAKKQSLNGLSDYESMFAESTDLFGDAPAVSASRSSVAASPRFSSLEPAAVLIGSAAIEVPPKPIEKVITCLQDMLPEQPANAADKGQMLTHMRQVREVIGSGKVPKEYYSDVDREFQRLYDNLDEWANLDGPDRYETQIQLAETILSWTEFRILCDLPQFRCKCKVTMTLVEKAEDRLRQMSVGLPFGGWGSRETALLENLRITKRKAIQSDSVVLTRLASTLQDQVKETMRLEKSLREKEALLKQRSGIKTK